MSKTAWVWTIIVIIVIAVVVWLLLGSGGTTPTTNPGVAGVGATSTTSVSTETSINPQSQNVTVTMTDSGFSPATVTIPQGATVTFINQSSEDMWIASNPHPVHTGYDDTSMAEHCVAGYAGPAPLDECAAVGNGGSFSFTFDKVGTWGYHNHADHAITGTVVVTALVQNGGIGPSASSSAQ